MPISCGSSPNYGIYGKVLTGTFAARPAAGISDRWYYATDTKVLYYDTGAAWVLMDLSHDSLSDVSVNDHHTPYWILVSDTLLDANATSVSFTSLDLDAVRAYWLLFSLHNPQGSSGGYYIYFNGDTVNTNYHHQYITANGASIFVGRVNNPILTNAFAGECVFGNVLIMRDVDGRPRALNTINLRDPASVRIEDRYIIWTTTANVTRIDVTGSVADSVGTGSRLLLFKAM